MLIKLCRGLHEVAQELPIDHSHSIKGYKTSQREFMFGYCKLQFYGLQDCLYDYLPQWIHDLGLVSIVYRSMEKVSFSECMIELYRPAEKKLIVAYVGTRTNC